MQLILSEDFSTFWVVVSSHVGRLIGRVVAVAWMVWCSRVAFDDLRAIVKETWEMVVTRFAIYVVGDVVFKGWWWWPAAWGGDSDESTSRPLHLPLLIRADEIYSIDVLIGELRAISSIFSRKQIAER